MENANIVKGFIERAQIDTISHLERKIVDAVKRKLTDIGCTVTEDDAASRIDGKLAAYIENFRSTGAKVAEETGCQIETRVILNYPAFHTCDDSDCIRLIRMAFKDLGIASTVEDGAGGFDANLLSRCVITPVEKRLSRKPGRGIIKFKVETTNQKNEVVADQMWTVLMATDRKHME